MKNIIFMLLVFFTMLGLSHGEEQPPYETTEPNITENFRQIYYQADRLSLLTNLLTYTFDSSNNQLCIDSTTLCIDANNHRVGIGTASPGVGYKLDIQRNTAGDTGQVRISGDNGTSDGGAGISFAYNNTTKWSMFSRNVASNAHSWALATSEGDYSTAVLKATQSGEITQPLQPSFLVTDGTGATDVTGDGTVYTELWPTEIYDQGSDFASNTFTAPVSGRYFFSASVDIRNLLIGHNIREIAIVTSNREYRWIFDETLAQNDQSLHVSCLADMDAADTATVTIRVIGGTKTVDILASGIHNNFSGSLIN